MGSRLPLEVRFAIGTWGVKSLLGPCAGNYNAGYYENRLSQLFALPSATREGSSLSARRFAERTDVHTELCYCAD
jgi:hypothetical protein